MGGLKLYMIIMMLGSTPHHFMYNETGVSQNLPAGDFFNYQLTKETKISISGSSNVNIFSCLAYQDFDRASGMILKNEVNNRIAFQYTSINIPVKSLSCDNEVMNFDMYQALKSDQYPYITLTVKEVYTANNQYINLSKSTSLIVLADLRLAGVSRSETIKITGSIASNGQYVFRGSHSINLQDFNIKAPTALFGVIKVKDEVKINFDLHVEVG